MPCTAITPADITAALPLAQCQINQQQLARANAIKTPLRRRAAFIAVARDALAFALIRRHDLKDFRQLTKAIRAADPDADFDQINRAAGAALFPSEVTL